MQKEEFEKYTKQLNELRMLIEETKTKYQKEVTNMNLHWEKLFNVFIPFIKSMDKMEKQKQIFMKAKIDEFLKIQN